MRKFLATIVLTVSFLPSYGQEFEQISRDALTCFEAGDLDNFEKTYTRLYPQLIKDNEPSYPAAVEAARKGDISGAVANLTDLIEEDYFLDEISTDPNFEVFHSHPEWQNFLKTTEERKRKYNDTLRRELLDVQYRDQGIRLLIMQSVGSQIMPALREYMDEVDRQSAQTVARILDTHGWLGADEIGSEANQTLFLAIQHINDSDIQHKYLPMLREAVGHGKAEGWHLAFLTDRILMNAGEKQIYGSQKISMTINDERKSFIVPLEHPNEVDRLRSEIGMEPLARAMEGEGWQWSLEDYLEHESRIEEWYREWYETFRAN